VREILSKFPKLIDTNKTTADADPFIIALALSRNCTVVTNERGGTSDNPKIPYVCEYYGVKCLSLIDFFREQKWEY